MAAIRSQRTRSGVRLASIALILALVLVANANVAGAEYRSGSTTWAGGITQHHRIDYNVKTTCKNYKTMGAAYQLYKTTNKWTRSDSQLSVKNGRGQRTIFTFQDCDGAPYSSDTKYTFASGGTLTLNSNYTVSHTTKYATIGGDGSFVGSLTRADVVRGGTVRATMCTQVTVKWTGC